jgi:hypothetical protein
VAKLLESYTFDMARIVSPLSSFNDCPIFNIFQNGFDGGMLGYILEWLSAGSEKQGTSIWSLENVPSSLHRQDEMPRPIQEPRPTHSQRLNIIANSSHKPNMWTGILTDSVNYVELIKDLYVKNVSQEQVQWRNHIHPTNHNSNNSSNIDGNNVNNNTIEGKSLEFEYEFDGKWIGDDGWEYSLIIYLAKVENREHEVLGKAPSKKYWCHGYIVWTLISTPEQSYEMRVGENAIEMVCGFIHHTSVDDIRHPIMINRNSFKDNNSENIYTHFELMGYTTFPLISEPILGPDWYRFKIKSKPIPGNNKQFDELHTRCFDFKYFVGRTAGNSGTFDSKIIIRPLKIPMYMHWEVPGADRLLQPIINSSTIDQLREEIVQLHFYLAHNYGGVFLSVGEVTKVLKDKKKVLEGWNAVKDCPNYNKFTTNSTKTVFLNGNKIGLANNLLSMQMENKSCNTAMLVGALLKVIRYYIKIQKEEVAAGNDITLEEMKLCSTCKNEIIYCKDGCVAIAIANMKKLKV